MAKAIFVGAGKDYADIKSAIKNANSNDIIVIDSGIYEENIIINKFVHLRGNTDNPEKGEVIIHGSNDIPVVFNYLPNEKELIYLEGLQFERDDGPCQKLCLIANSNSNLSIIFNRCRILGGSAQYPISISNNVYTDNVVIEHCYLQRGEAHLSRFIYKYNNYSKITKTELNTSFAATFCKNRPNKVDVVTIPTLNYGPAYGSYYNQIPARSLKLPSLWQRIKNKLGFK